MGYELLLFFKCVAFVQYVPYFTRIMPAVFIRCFSLALRGLRQIHVSVQMTCDSDEAKVYVLVFKQTEIRCQSDLPNGNGNVRNDWEVNDDRQTDKRTSPNLQPMRFTVLTTVTAQLLK